MLAWSLAANTLRPKILEDGTTVTFFVLLGTLPVFSAVFLVARTRT